MKEAEIRLTVLGARGSMPVSTADKIQYGGATSAYLLETEDQAIFLDAGTGLINAPDVGEKAISLLLTHPHFDHLAGLAMFRYLICKDRRIDINAEKRNGLTARDQIDTLMAEPLWPVGIDALPVHSAFHNLEYAVLLSVLVPERIHADFSRALQPRILGHGGYNYNFYLRQLRFDFPCGGKPAVAELRHNIHKD